MDLSRLQKLSYLIIALLGVGLLSILIYVQVLGVTKGKPEARSTQSAVGGLRASEAAQGFDIEVLRDPRFEDLDRSLFDGGRLPVPAPAVRGRPNLF